MSADADDARMPALIVLPLVQHAIVGATEGGARLGIASHLRAQTLRVAIETSTADFARSEAPALIALRERLHALYGERASLWTTATASGSRAELAVPVESLTPA